MCKKVHYFKGELTFLRTLLTVGFLFSFSTLPCLSTEQHFSEDDSYGEDSRSGANSPSQFYEYYSNDPPKIAPVQNGWWRAWQEWLQTCTVVDQEGQAIVKPQLDLAAKINPDDQQHSSRITLTLSLTLPNGDIYPFPPLPALSFQHRSHQSDNYAGLLRHARLWYKNGKLYCAKNYGVGYICPSVFGVPALKFPRRHFQAESQWSPTSGFDEIQTLALSCQLNNMDLEDLPSGFYDLLTRSGCETQRQIAKPYIYMDTIEGDRHFFLTKTVEALYREEALYRGNGQIYKIRYTLKTDNVLELGPTPQFRQGNPPHKGFFEITGAICNEIGGNYQHNSRHHERFLLQTPLTPLVQGLVFDPNQDFADLIWDLAHTPSCLLSFLRFDGMIRTTKQEWLVTDLLSQCSDVYSLSLKGACSFNCAALQSLVTLHHLDLSEIHMPYGNFSDLTHLTNLATLDLSYFGCKSVGLKDQDVVQLTGLTQLQTLNLSGNVLLTDKIVESLITMTWLDRLYIKGCENISEQGRATLRSVFPRLES